MVVSALLPDPRQHGVAGALSHLITLGVDAAHPSRRAEGDEGYVAMAFVLTAHFAGANSELGLGQHDDAPPLGRLVGERCKLCAIGEQLGRDAGHRQELRCLSVAERDRAGLV